MQNGEQMNLKILENGQKKMTNKQNFVYKHFFHKNYSFKFITSHFDTMRLFT